MSASPLVLAVLELLTLVLFLAVTSGLIYRMGARYLGIETPTLDRLVGWIRRKKDPT